MVTRVVCFILGLVFLLSFLGIILLTIRAYSRDPSADINNQKIQDISDRGFGTLINPPSLEERLQAVEVSNIDLGEGEQSVVLTDHIELDYDIALAQSGQIYDTSDTTKIANAQALSLGVRVLPEIWQEIVLGMKLKAKKRILIPESEIKNYSTPDQININKGDIRPSGFDIAIDITLSGIADRPPGLEDFTALIEPIEILKLEDTVEGQGITVEANHKTTINFKAVVASSNQQITAKQDSVQTLNTINNWNNLLIGMKVGGTRRAFIPKDDLSLYIEDKFLVKDRDGVIEIEVTSSDLNDREDLKVEGRIEELRIEDVIEGEGQTAELDDLIEVKYTGVLATNGIIFEETPTSTQFALSESGLIAGWVQGLVGMKVGGKRQLYIPAELAYGEQERTSIPANSDLVFEIELINIIE